MELSSEKATLVVILSEAKNLLSPKQKWRPFGRHLFQQDAGHIVALGHGTLQ